MAYKLKQSKLKEKDLFKLPEEKNKIVKKDSYEKEQKDSKEESNMFSMKSDMDSHIEEINDELHSQDSPIRVKNKNTLLVEANGKTHTVTKDDVVKYHEKYRLDGVDGNDIQGFRNIGSIKGDYQFIHQIYQDLNHTFNRIDEHSGGYKTVPDEEEG